MYKVSPTFNDLMNDQKGFFIKMARQIHKQPHYRHNSFEDIFQMVLSSGFQAWKYQLDKSTNGYSQYAFGTFFNNCIKNGFKEYNDLKQANHITVIDSVKLVDYPQEIPDDLHNFYTRGLNELENKVYHHLFVDELNVNETAKKLNISSEYVRHIWNKVKEKVQEKLC